MFVGALACAAASLSALVLIADPRARGEMARPS
jgi:hypothetical protein